MRTLKLIFLFASLFFLKQGFSSPADTLRITTHQRVLIVTDPSKGEKHHMQWAVFPNTGVQIRNIKLHITLACTDTMRCADWDYVDQILLVKSGGATSRQLNWELARIITPYGGAFNRHWSFTWQTDITDFSPVLRDSVLINYIHTGYEPNHDRGWILTLTFELIQGAPAIIPLHIEQLCNDVFAYGDSLRPFDSLLKALPFGLKGGATHARLRIIQTGHGMDEPDNCAEFCSKYREIWLDNRLVDRRQLWAECGDNPVYPQAGTWIFDRANWCPGKVVQPDIIDLPVSTGRVHYLKIAMEPYIASRQNNGSQRISAYIIYHRGQERSNDVAIEDVIAPSLKQVYGRQNPAVANPKIIVRNHGTEEITSMTIEYGSARFSTQRHQWKGSLLPHASATITLPGRIESSPGINHFYAAISLPNGRADLYPADNRIFSEFQPAPGHDTVLVFRLLTNNEPGQNSWQLLSENREVIAGRKHGNLHARTWYTDTLRVRPGAYSLVFKDEAGDGLEFWYNTTGGRGEAMLMDSQSNLLKYFEPDFGSGWEYHFTAGLHPDVPDPEARAVSLYPTRTSDTTTLNYLANRPEDVKIRLVADPGGQVLEEHQYAALKEASLTFDLRRYAYGRFYLKVFVNDQEVFNKRVRYTEPPKKAGSEAYQWPADPLVSQKLTQWQDWKFGVLIHWGPYSQWGVVESWSICPEDEPWCIRRGPYSREYHTYVSQYRRLFETFNPTAFDPQKWARACSRAGMRYVIFTTKHHDGFCMFDSKCTDYKITAKESAYSDNPRSNIAWEVFDAFRQQGMAAGVYFSKPDWNHPDYWWPYFPVSDRNVNYDPRKYPEKWDRFKAFTHNQIEELVSEYGPVDILWLDGGWVRPAGSLTSETRPWLGKNQWIQDIDMPAIVSTARKHQPGLLVVDRTVHGEFENYRTPEQQIPDKNPGYPWESCISLGDNWYSTGPGEQYKSTRWIIHTLVKIVARGGNFLLGIGPDHTGDMVKEVYDRLEKTAEWININSKAIYDTKPIAPFSRGRFFFTQSKDEKRRYIICLAEEGEKWPVIWDLPAEVTAGSAEAELLGFDKKLKLVSEKGVRKILLPKTLPVHLSSMPALVIAITVK